MATKNNIFHMSLSSLWVEIKSGDRAYTPWLLNFLSCLENEQPHHVEIVRCIWELGATEVLPHQTFLLIFLIVWVKLNKNFGGLSRVDVTSLCMRMARYCCVRLSPSRGSVSANYQAEKRPVRSGPRPSKKRRKEERCRAADAAGGGELCLRRCSRHGNGFHPRLHHKPGVNSINVSDQNRSNQQFRDVRILTSNLCWISFLWILYGSMLSIA